MEFDTCHRKASHCSIHYYEYFALCNENARDNQDVQLIFYKRMVYFRPINRFSFSAVLGLNITVSVIFQLCNFGQSLGSSADGKQSYGSEASTVVYMDWMF